MSLTIGKWRRLQQASSCQGTFSVLAIDHRGPLRPTLEAESPGIDVDDALGALKQDMARALGPVSSAVLLDPDTGAGQCVASGALSGDTALIVALDSGSSGDPYKREASLVPDWTVEKACRMGAAGIKLLIYYHPDTPEAAECEKLVREIGRECARYEMPLFLEPLSYCPDKKLGTLPSAARQEVVIESARRLIPLGVDVLKAEFPVDVKQQPEEDVWRDACQQLSAACAVPWVLLSAGVSFETFLRQTRIACDAGASGVMVGRAVWKEAVTGDTLARNHFLNGIARERMCRLRSLCDALGRPFTDIYERPALSPNWYRKYGASDADD
jgi:tagatose-1,6-bisphosphate aldolase